MVEIDKLLIPSDQVLPDVGGEVGVENIADKMLVAKSFPGKKISQPILLVFDGKLHDQALVPEYQLGLWERYKAFRRAWSKQSGYEPFPCEDGNPIGQCWVSSYVFLMNELSNQHPVLKELMNSKKPLNNSKLVELIKNTSEEELVSAYEQVVSQTNSVARVTAYGDDYHYVLRSQGIIYDFTAGQYQKSPASVVVGEEKLLKEVYKVSQVAEEQNLVKFYLLLFRMGLIQAGVDIDSLRIK
jgi:hypothetical protein